MHPPTHHTSEAATTDGFDDLESLLTTSMEFVAQRDEVKALRTKKRQGRIPAGNDLKAANATIAKWENEREWKPQATVAIFNIAACACGSTHSLFSGFFQRQRHVSSRVDRWVKAEYISPSLTKERLDMEQPATPVCSDCALKQGYVQEGQLVPEPAEPTPPAAAGAIQEGLPLRENLHMEIIKGGESNATA